MNKFMIGMGFFLLLLVFALPPAADDDFSGEFLAPSIWQESDIARHVDEDEDMLLSGVRSARQGDLNRSWCRFPSPGSIYGIRSKIRISVDNDVVQNMSGNAEAGARIMGGFYNRDSASPISRVGDVFAVVEIRDRGAGLEAWFEVVAFLNYPASSSADYDILMEQQLDSGGLAEEVFYVAQLEYDPGADEIRGALYDESGTTLIGSATYAITSNLANAFQRFRLLETFAYNDTSLASADFDDVYIQSTSGGPFALYDDFDNEFDHSKWVDCQIVRYIEDDHLILGVSEDDNPGAKRTVRATMVDLPDYLEAMVTLSGDVTVENETGNYGRARLEGVYYNDKNVAYNGYDGDCLAQVKIEKLADGSIYAGYNVVRSNNADFTSQTMVTFDAFDASGLALDVPVKMAIEYTGTAFNFTLGDQTKSWTIVPLDAKRDANMPRRALAARVYDTQPSGTGMGLGSVAVAEFDDVKTSKVSTSGGSGSSGGSTSANDDGGGGGGGCFIRTAITP